MRIKYARQALAILAVLTFSLGSRLGFLTILPPVLRQLKDLRKLRCVPSLWATALRGFSGTATIKS